MGGKASQISPSNQGRGKAARLGVKRLERGKQWVSQGYPSGVVACGLEQLVTRQVHVTLAKVKLLEASSICP